MKSFPFKQKLLPRLAGILLAVASGSASAWWPGLVDLWSFDIQMKDGVCVDNMRFDWGDLRHLKIRGSKGRRVCNGTAATSFDTAMPQEPFNISWTDGAGGHHEYALPLKKLLDGKVVYGGGLYILVSESDVSVLLEEPDKSKNPHDTFWPKKPAQLIYTTEPAKAAGETSK